MDQKQRIVNLLMVGFLIMAWQNTLHGASSVGKAIEVFGKTEELKYTRQTKTAPLVVDLPLYYQDGVLTGPMSSTRLLMEDPTSKMKAALYVFENSKLILDKEVIKHTQGALSVLVKGLKKGEELQIVTPHATLGVRGSSLFEELDKDSIKVTVGGGEVYSYSSTGAFRLTPGFIYHMKNGQVVEKEAASKNIPQLAGNWWTIWSIAPVYSHDTSAKKDTALERRATSEYLF